MEQGLFYRRSESFQTVRIMTGAAIPRGCNAVVMLELTEGFEKRKDYMTLKRCFAAGDNISFKGEDVKQNTILVKKGLLLTWSCSTSCYVWL